MKSDFGTFQNRRQVGIGQRAGWADTSSTARATANAAGTGLILAESHLLSEFIMQYLRLAGASALQCSSKSSFISGNMYL